MTKFNLDKLREIAKPRELSRAEEMALKAYPRDEDRELNFRRTNYRIAYERGYKQAEKDLALTWEDIRKIVTLFSEVSFECFDTKSANEMCEETLTRFKQFKEAKQ